MDYQLLQKKIDSILVKSMETNQVYINFYQKQIEFYEKMLQKEMNAKPPKFMKGAYDEWQKKVDIYIDKIIKFLTNIEEEFDEINETKKNISSRKTNISIN